MSSNIDHMLSLIKKIIPAPIFRAFQPAYHFLLAFAGAIRYGFPTKKLFVIGVTGTKGKTTVAELVNVLLEEAGYKTALAGTLRFKIGKDSKPNLYKMTMPGRFTLQKFFSDAVESSCTHAVVEITSEGSRQFRHRFISLDALIFTNLEPEHIESHGSYEKYVAAKVDIARQLLRGGKKNTLFIGNKDDKETSRFTNLPIPQIRLYSLEDAKPYSTIESKMTFAWRGTDVHTHLVGEFNIRNCLAALSLSEALSINKEKAIKAIEEWRGAPGRQEEVKSGQPFKVVIDYAHTPKSLEALYSAYDDTKKICVLSGTGGGRDRWKRPLMGEIASNHCDHIILTDEDPYDENPESIVADIKKGIDNPHTEIELDRRIAIQKALKKGAPGNVVLITGKGTDPYIMGPKGARTPWSDATIAKEELEKLGFKP